MGVADRRRGTWERTGEFMSTFTVGDRVRVAGSFDDAANIRGATSEVAEFLPGTRPGYDYKVLLDGSPRTISVFHFEIEANS